jgi:hypothetical protein
MKSIYKVYFICTAIAALAACGPKGADDKTTNATGEDTSIDAKINQLVTVQLTADISGLSKNDRKMLPFMFQVADIMDELFWEESLGGKNAFLDTIKDEKIRRYAMINYGPWERLNDDKPFIKGVGKKPEGANFYPKDMTKDEFEKWTSPNKKGLYSMVRRDDGGFLKTIPYHEYFKEKIDRAAALIDSAAKYADDAGLKKYLTLRAQALRTDDYQASDFAWLDMKNNTIDFVVGPIESYEDKLFGYRTSHEAYILIKDKTWSEKLAKYAAMLPELQAGLPVDAKYKAEKAGSDSDLGAYDVVYYAGDCNAGSKTIAVNLPNDENVQLKKGTRRLQLKNAMRAKFDKIMMPIADELIDPSQRANVTFDAFFSTVMFHEVAHGLGIKNTINGKGMVREALKDEASALEEGKADILGLYMITKLYEKGEFTKKDLDDCYITFMAGIFRSVRFGAASAHGKANMLRFNYFADKGAFTRTPEGKYKVDLVKMKDAMTSLSALILKLQGDGDYDGVKKLMAEKGKILPQLQGDLDRLKAKKIPVDIVFEQGMKVLGLQ